MIDAPELRKSTAKVLKQVIVDEEHLVVNHNFCPLAVMMPYPDNLEMMLAYGHTVHRSLAKKLTRMKGDDEEPPKMAG